MLTPTQIGRFIANKDFRRLIDRLLSNGRCHSRRAQARLHEPEALEVAAIGLGLQRICELAYWSVPDGSDLAHQLLRLQRRDGSFGQRHAVADSQHLIEGSAVALRALIEWLDAFDHREDERSLLEQSIERGLLALKREWRQRETGDSNDLAWAIVLWQMGDEDRARERLPMTAIRKRLSSVSPALLADDLTRLALTMAA